MCQRSELWGSLKARLCVLTLQSRSGSGVSGTQLLAEDVRRMRVRAPGIDLVVVNRLSPGRLLWQGADAAGLTPKAVPLM